MAEGFRSFLRDGEVLVGGGTPGADVGGAPEQSLIGGERLLASEEERPESSVKEIARRQRVVERQASSTTLRQETTRTYRQERPVEPKPPPGKISGGLLNQAESGGGGGARGIIERTLAETRRAAASGTLISPGDSPLPEQQTRECSIFFPPKTSKNTLAWTYHVEPNVAAALAFLRNRARIQGFSRHSAEHESTLAALATVWIIEEDVAWIGSKEAGSDASMLQGLFLAPELLAEKADMLAFGRKNVDMPDCRGNKDHLGFIRFEEDNWWGSGHQTQPFWQHVIKGDWSKVCSISTLRDE